MNIKEFSIPRKGYELLCSLAEPEEDKKAQIPALLLSFAYTRRSVLDEPLIKIPTDVFIDAGHYVLSFDLPHHGRRVVSYGEGIAAMCSAFMAGEDPFQFFVSDAIAAIDACLEEGLVSEDRIVVCGTSRGGYCALRLAAADRRVRAVSALSPVTDWSILDEFSSVRSHPGVAELALENWVDGLIGRSVFLVVGNHDERVGTHSCARLALRLFEEEKLAGGGKSSIQLHIVKEISHSLSGEWRTKGALFLLDELSDVSYAGCSPTHRL